MYFQDFEDYGKMEVPYVFERVVVSDRKAAALSLERKNHDGDQDVGKVEPEFLTAFELGGMREERVGDYQKRGEWWEPIRRNMLEFLDLDQEEGEESWEKKKKPVVTYIVSQDMEHGPKLKAEDHARLVSLLQKMERNLGCQVNIINEDTRRTSWIERMEAIVRSSVSAFSSWYPRLFRGHSSHSSQVIIGVHGDHLLDFVFMKRGPRSTLVEMYPENRFVRDRAVVVESLGQHYVAWSGSQ